MKCLDVNQITLIELMISISGEFRIGFSKTDWHYLQETMDFRCSDSKVILANPSNNAGPIYYHFKHSPYESRCLCFNGGWVMSSWTTWQIIDQSPYSFSQKQEFEQQRNLRSQFSLCCQSLLLLYTDLHNFADRWRKSDLRKIRSLRTNTLFRAVFTPFTKLKFLPHQRPSTKCNTCNTKDWGKVGVANSLLNKVEMVGDNASRLSFVILNRK